MKTLPITVFAMLLATNPSVALGDKMVIKCQVSRVNMQELISLDDGVWRKYTKALADRGGDSVEVATVRRGRDTFVAIDSNTAGDIFTHHELCYDKSGKLLASYYEVRTAWGWGYVEGGDKVHFFDTENGNLIPTPESPMDGRELAKHPSYSTFKELPFSSLVTLKYAPTH